MLMNSRTSGPNLLQPSKRPGITTFLNVSRSIVDIEKRTNEYMPQKSPNEMTEFILEYIENYLPLFSEALTPGL